MIKKGGVGIVRFTCSLAADWSRNEGPSLGLFLSHNEHTRQICPDCLADGGETFVQPQSFQRPGPCSQDLIALSHTQPLIAS